MSVTKADLEKAKRVAEVDLSDWISGEDTTGYVCSIRAGLLLKLSEAADSEAEGLASERAATYAWVVNCFCDQDGVLILDDSDDSTAWLSDRPFKMLQLICEAAMTINGVAGEDTEKN